MAYAQSIAHSDREREAIEVAARPLRELQKAEHDEIAAAQRALREAEHAHARAIASAERDLRGATRATPIAAYGHHLILFEDRLSVEGANHPLAPGTTARVADAEGEGLTLTVEGSDWTEVVGFPHRHARKARKLAEAIETAAGAAEGVADARRSQGEAAERDLAAATLDRDSVQRTRELVHKLGELCDDDEDVLDMAPALSAGHDGILVATDRRLLFVSMRRTLSFLYRDISSVAAKGRWLGTRLTVSTSAGKAVFGGLERHHAAELEGLVGSRAERPAATA